MPLVYNELRSLARRYLRDERPGHTLQATALVNEVYLRLVDQRTASFRCRTQDRSSRSRWGMGVVAALVVLDSSDTWSRDRRSDLSASRRGQTRTNDRRWS